jgi:DNA polymerase-3 subunit epsilon
MTVLHALTKQLSKTGVTTYRCEICGWVFKRETTAETCPGVKAWGWNDWAKHGLLTKKQLYDAGYSTGKTKLPKPSGAVPREKSPDGWMYLYNPADAVVRKEADEATRARLDLARQKFLMGWTCKRCGGHVEYYKRSLCRHCQHELWLEDVRAETIEEAKQWLALENAVIVDCETDGLDWSREILSLAVIDLKGKVLFNQLIKPPLKEDGQIHVGPTEIHGITPEMLLEAFPFADYYPQLAEIFEGKVLLAYNIDFDHSSLNYTCNRLELEPFNFAKRHCLMELFAQYVGDYSHYWRDFRWQSLPGATHNALEDCQAALELLKEMAETLPEADEEITEVIEDVVQETS